MYTMVTLDKNSIDSLVSYIRENLSISIFAGEGDNRRCLIKPGLKIRNKESGINYTVNKVHVGDDGLLIQCFRAPDFIFTMTEKDLKDFERI